MTLSLALFDFLRAVAYGKARSRGMGRRPPGMYYGWGVGAVCFLFVAARRGSETAYAVLLVVLVQEFGWQRATITGAFSLAMLVGGLLTPLAGRLLDRFDPRLAFGIGSLALGLAALALLFFSLHVFLKVRFRFVEEL